MIPLSEEHQQAVAAVSAICLPDMDFCDAPQEEHGELMAEIVIDAGRLEIYGYPGTQEIIREAIDEFGYSTVLKEVAKYVYC